MLEIQSAGKPKSMLNVHVLADRGLVTRPLLGTLSACQLLQCITVRALKCSNRSIVKTSIMLQFQGNRMKFYSVQACCGL